MKEDIGHRIDELWAECEKHRRAMKIVAWTMAAAVGLLLLTWPPHVRTAMASAVGIAVIHNWLRYQAIQALIEVLNDCEDIMAKGGYDGLEKEAGEVWTTSR